MSQGGFLKPLRPGRCRSERSFMNDPGPELIARACRGDREAFEALVRRTERRIGALAFRWLGDAHEALDLVQEIYVRLYENFDKYDTARPFWPWFLRLATHAAMNHLRSRKRRPLTLVPFEEEQFDPADPDAVNPAEKVVRDAEAGALQELFEEMPEEYRAILGLRYTESMSYGEIGEVLGLPAGTVKNRLFRAREMLKDLVRTRKAAPNRAGTEGARGGDRGDIR